MKLHLDFSEDDSSNSSNEYIICVPKSSKSRMRAENADLKISILGLTLRLDVLCKECIAATTPFKKITEEVSFQDDASPMIEGSINEHN